MQEKVVVITGATSGIGLVAATRLAVKGARLVLVGRNRERGEDALKNLPKAGRAAAHSVHYADLSSIAETKRVATEIAAAEPRIDVLINNAGAMFSRRRVSADGLEMTFALNHVSYFVLTLGLAEPLFATPGARVVNTASAAHQGAHLDFDDLQSARRYRGFAVYGRSKLCNILFTRELARRWRDRGVTANALHPGFVATRFGRESGGPQALLTRGLQLFALSPEKGSDTIVHLASSSEVAGITGAYFYRQREISPSSAAQDDAIAARLWEESARLAGLS